MAQNVLSERRVMVNHLEGKGQIAKSFPEDVRDAILQMVNEHSNLVKSFMFRAVEEGYKFYAGEGYSYKLVVGEDQRAVEMVAEHNLGASGLSHAINAEIVVPVGGFLIQVGYYGGYIMTVYNVQPKVLPPPEPSEETAKQQLAASIGLDLANVDTEKGVVTCACGSLVPTMKNGDQVCIICGRGQNIGNFLEILKKGLDCTYFVDVKYEEFKPETYGGLQLRVMYYGLHKSKLLYRSPKNSIVDNQKRFEDDWTKLCRFAIELGIQNE